METCTPWIFENNPVTEIETQYVGFVYCITNLIDGRKYIGKKKSTFVKTSIKTVKLKSGEKRKKKIRSTVDSDWREYFGSSEELKADVTKLGDQNFSREILKFCSTLSELSYVELKYQIDLDVLLHPDKYYNSWVCARIRRSHLIKSV